MNTTETMSAEMRKFYGDYLIDNAEPELVFDRFAQKKSVPKGGGKTVVFRKYSPLPEVTQPLTEGVTPEGQSMTVEAIEAELSSHGGFVELSDMLTLTAVDDNLAEATKLLGAQAGRTLNSITREILCGGTNVRYADAQKTARYQLDSDDIISVDTVRRAVRDLRKLHAEKIKGDYVAIIHPDVAYDLMSDERWVNVKSYSDPEGIYEGEIGKLEGVRFIESEEAKVYTPEAIFTDGSTYGTVSSVSTKTFTLSKTPKSDLEKVLIEGVLFEVASVSGDTITVKDIPAGVTVKANDKICAANAGADGVKIYATLVFGANAYGITNLEGEGLHHIVHQLGSGGTEDPLNQRATAGWKSTRAVCRLLESSLIRIESAATQN